MHGLVVMVMVVHGDGAAGGRVDIFFSAFSPVYFAYLLYSTCFFFHMSALLLLSFFFFCFSL